MSFCVVILFPSFEVCIPVGNIVISLQVVHHAEYCSSFVTTPPRTLTALVEHNLPDRVAPQFKKI
jgi:hypothetical protein